MSMRVPRVARAFALLALLAVAACATEKPAPAPAPTTEVRPRLTPVAITELPGWSADRQGEAVIALQRSCVELARLPDDRLIEAAGITGIAAAWRSPCAAAFRVNPADHAAARALFEGQFQAYRLSDGDRREGLFTGYYEPELTGCRTPRPGCAVPLYRAPDDLISVDLGAFREELKGQRIAGRVENRRLVPYADRAAIERGALAGRGLELVYVADRVEAFFLEIQGSGRILLEDGTIMKVGYADQNGHIYSSIGRELVRRGAMTADQASMSRIKAWVAANPGRAADEILQSNRSSVFFRETKGDSPIGAQGVVLIAGRSLAVDRRYVPLGAPMWVDIDEPTEPGGRIRRLMVAQDVGGAIRGVVRGDVFWGTGPAAGERAGRMRQQGEAFVLLPRGFAVGTPSS